MEIDERMVYSPVVQELRHQKAQQRTFQKTAQKTAQSRFLIIGYGSDEKGDKAVGLQIAKAVSAWNIPLVKSVATYYLTPDLVNQVASVDYAFFVGCCHGAGHAQTLQIDPIIANSHLPRSLAKDSHLYNLLMLLSLSQQLYDRSPQSWLLQIPVKRSQCQGGLSSTAQRGYDHALRTLEQFFQTYR